MFFNRKKKRGSFVKAKTQESRKRQRAAIAAYYARNKENSKKKGK